MIKKIITIIGVPVFFTIAVALMLPGIKGTNNDPNYYQSSRNREVGGPFESSGSTSRYALTEKVALDNSFTFTKEEAAFASPDVVGSKGKYYSIFMPGVSFAAVPLYKLGAAFGMPQIGAYTLNIVFALLNTLLIMGIVRKITGGIWTGIFSGFVFLFATNAFPYAFFFSQHHVSTFCLLSVLYLWTFSRNILTNTLAGLIYGYSIFVDIPNAFLLFPPILAIALGNISVKKFEQRVTAKVRVSMIMLILSFFAMLGVIGMYNNAVTGTYTNLPQFIGRSDDFRVEPSKDPVNKPEVSESEKNLNPEPQSPFVTRFLINGFYILLASDERGWLFYSPILFLGILGLHIGLKKSGMDPRFVQIIFSVIMTNLLLYSMFGDPWGGWSFGPRYMIPAAAGMSILIGYATAAYRGKIVYLMVLLILLTYSTFINTTAVVTTTEIPPKQEAIHLLNYTPYTYQYNIDLLDQNFSRTFFYLSYFKDVFTLREFLIMYWLAVLLLTSGALACATLEPIKKT